MPIMINNLLGQYTVVVVYLLTISKRNIIRILSLSQRMMCIFKNGWRLSLSNLTADEVSNQDWELKVTAEQMLVCDICCL